MALSMSVQLSSRSCNAYLTDSHTLYLPFLTVFASEDLFSVPYSFRSVGRE